MSDGRVYLTVEQAMDAMAWHDYDDEGTQAVHSFREATIAMIGADWTREDVEVALGEHRPELLGPGAQSLGHGVGFIDKYGLVAFETVPEKIRSLEAAGETAP